MTAGASPLRCFHASNALTYASLLASVGAVGCAFQGRPGASGALIALAVILDTFDGRFAGLFRRSATQRAIGVQLDSLSDAVSFGIVPAVCMMVLRWRPPLGGLSPASAGLSAAPAGLSPALEMLLWTSVFAFAACAITRLAFYNVTHEQTDGFVGLPAPVAALVWATVLLLNPGAAASTAVFFITAAAMVLPLPIPRPQGLAFAAFVCWPLALIAAHIGT